MERSKLRKLIGIVVVVAGVAAVVVFVREVSRCRPDSETPALIEKFRADPLMQAVPDDGRLSAEDTSPDHCIEVSGDPYPPPPALYRTYGVPAKYDLQQLHRLLDGPAAASGFTTYEESDHGGRAFIRWCTQAEGRAISAFADSTSDEGLVVSMIASEPDSTCP